jgi:DNA-binding NarL/FixJ family response regulator
MEVLPTLLIEDDGFSAGLITTWLAEFAESFDFRVFRVTSIAQATDAFKVENAHKWGLIILDLILPNGIGTSALRSIREMAPDVPLVVVTSLSAENVAKESCLLHADDFLVKWVNGCKDGVSFCQNVRKAVWRRRAINTARAMVAPLKEMCDKGSPVSGEFAAISEARAAMESVSAATDETRKAQ